MFALSAAGLVACNRDAAEDQSPESQQLEKQRFGKYQSGRHAQQEFSQQGTALVCGDGVWEPGEACDLQIGSTSSACSEECQIQSIPVTEGEVIEDGQPRVERYVGTSRHPSAVSRAGFGVIFLEIPALERVEADAGSGVEAAEPDPVVRAEFFSRDGARRGNLLLSDGLQAVYGASPALSALGDGGFVAAFEAFDSDSDELGIALRRVNLSTAPSVSFTAGLHVTANQQATADQYDPDVLRVGSGLIVAWTDDSNAATSPDLRFRKFSENLNPNSDEQTLADTDGIEGSVALSAFGNTWAAAWRSIPLQGANFADLDAGVSSAEEFSGAEQLVVAAPDLALRWTVSGLSPAPADDRPALIALNDETLLVAFAVGTQPEGHDLADVSRLRVAVLHEGNVGEVTPCDPGPSSAGPGSVGVFAAPDVSLGQPALAMLENEALLGWRSTVVPGNALGERSLGDELWQRGVSWAPAPAVLTGCTDLDFTDAVPAPAAEEEREDDQRHLGLIAERGLLIATWEDYGRTQSSAQGTPDVLVRLSPFATLCSEEDPCGNGEGHCESDEECEGDLKCGSNNGEAFGYQENINVCIPCGNGITELGEECDESLQTPTCNANCTLPFCGDGVVQDADEQCEPVVPFEDDEDCNASCSLAQCGDGYVNAAAEEECEPLESGVNDAECDANCTFAECGDGVLNPSAGETCELTSPSCGLDCGVGTCPSGGCLRLESRLVSVAVNDSEMHPQLRLTNLSAQTLDLEEYSLRYWFHDSSSASYDLTVLWDPAFVVEGMMAVSTVSPARVKANRYVEVPLEGTLGASSGPGGTQLSLEFRWRHQGGSPSFNESNDYSYLETLSYTENTKITVYRSGILVWGEEPAVIPVCGNGVLEMGEACDTSGQSGDCDADCSLVVCGDGTVNSSANEECDPGDDPQCMPDCSGLMACTNPAECLHIKYHHYSDDTPTNEQIKFAFQLVNNSDQAVALSDITIRYWFTKEPSGTFQTACDFTTVAGGCSSVVHGGNHGTVSPARGGANYVWRTGFTSGAGTLAANSSSGEVLIRGQNDPWLPFNENEDYSYINTITPTVTTTITVYLNGELVWGEEPEVTGQVCGNSSVTGTEQCDTGSQSSSCDADCTTPVCGDGTVNSNAGEACDPASDPACRPDCLGPLYCTDSATCLHVKLRTHSNDTPTNSQIRPLFQLINNGPSAVTLSDLKIRYWFTKEPSGTFQPFCDSTPTSGGCGAISSNHAAISPALSGANYYWETTFTSAAGSLAMGTSSGDIRLHAQTSSGGNFSEGSDYSYPYPNPSTIRVTTKVALYYNNVLVWGQEPPPAPPVCPNNIMEGTEQCDTGGQSSTCDADCTFPTCGDATVNSAAGEVCDTALDSQCNSTCTGFITCSSSSSCLHVTYAHNIEDTASNNTIKPRFNVVNNGSTTVSLSQIRIRYWFTKEPSAAFQTWCDFATLGCSSIVHNASSGALSPTKPTANYFWEVGFTSGSLAPGQSTGEIVVRANVVDWANFNESNDYSYANLTTPAPRSQIGLYKNGTRVWGSAP